MSTKSSNTCVDAARVLQLRLAHAERTVHRERLIHRFICHGDVHRKRIQPEEEQRHPCSCRLSGERGKRTAHQCAYGVCSAAKEHAEHETRRCKREDKERPRHGRCKEYRQEEGCRCSEHAPAQSLTHRHKRDKDRPQHPHHHRQHGQIDRRKRVDHSGSRHYPRRRSGSCTLLTHSISFLRVYSHSLPYINTSLL